MTILRGKTTNGFKNWSGNKTKKPKKGQGDEGRVLGRNLTARQPEVNSGSS